jgi:hypothetical protein
VKVREIRQRYRELEQTLLKLEAHFVKRYLVPPPALGVNKREMMATSAYIVLAHAALEGFFEQLAEWILKRTVANWTNKKRLSRATACLLLATTPKPDHATKSTFDQIRLALDEQKAAMSKAIRVDNHGISERHLRTILGPLGLDMAANPAHVTALMRLSSERGSKAHNAVGATVHITAASAKTWVDDCLDLASDMLERAITMRT